MDGTVLAVTIGAGVVALIVLLVVVSYRREKRWRLAVHEWAAHNGWLAEFGPRVPWAGRLPGRNTRGMRLLLSGVVGDRRVAVGNYEYQTSSSSTSYSSTENRHTTSTTTHTHRYVVTVVSLGHPTPALAIRPRGAVSRLGRRLFGSDTGGDFEHRFRVDANPPEAARELVGPALMAAHLADRLPMWSLHDGVLLSCQQGRFTDPAAAPGLAAPLVAVADLLGR